MEDSYTDNFRVRLVWVKKLGPRYQVLLTREVSKRLGSRVRLAHLAQQLLHGNIAELGIRNVPLTICEREAKSFNQCMQVLWGVVLHFE